MDRISCNVYASNRKLLCAHLPCCFVQAVLSVYPNAIAMHPGPTPIETSYAVQAGAPALLFVAVENTVEVALIVIVSTIGAAATDTVDVVALPDCVLKMDLSVCNCFRDVDGSERKRR